MKKYLIPAIFALIATFFVACDDEKDSANIVAKDKSQLTQTVYADQTTGESTVSFTTEGAWSSTITEKVPTRAVSPDWISVSPESGDHAGDYTIEITLQKNTTGQQRAAVVTITCNGNTIAVNVTQQALNEDGTDPDNGPDESGGKGTLKYSILTTEEFTVDAVSRELYSDTENGTFLLNFYSGDKLYDFRLILCCGAESEKITAGTYTGVPYRGLLTQKNTFYVTQKGVLGDDNYYYYNDDNGGTVKVETDGDAYLLTLDINVTNGSGMHGKITGTYTGFIPKEPSQNNQ